MSQKLLVQLGIGQVILEFHPSEKPLLLELYRLTVCVTCAGAGTAKPSSQKNDKALKTAWDLRRLPSVRCTLCWAVFL